MPTIHVHISGDARGLQLDMPNLNLLTAYIGWLQNRKRNPDHYVGLTTANQNVGVFFPMVAAMKEQVASPSMGIQESPALGGRRLGVRQSKR
jgi:hypothetical protein